MRFRLTFQLIMPPLLKCSATEQPRLLKLRSPYHHRPHCIHNRSPPPLLSMTAPGITCRTVNENKTDVREPPPHHRLTKWYRIRHVLKSPDIILRTDTLTHTPNTIWRITEYHIYKVQRRLPMCRLVLVHKLSKINIMKRTYTVHSLPSLPHRHNHRRIKLKR